MDLMVKRQRLPWWKTRLAVIGVSAAVILTLVVGVALQAQAPMALGTTTTNIKNIESDSDAVASSSTRRLTMARKITVYASLPTTTPQQEHDQQNLVARKQQQDLMAFTQRSDTGTPSTLGAEIVLEPIYLNLEQQRDFVEANNCGEAALARFNELVQRQQEHLATEVWKYCALKETEGADAVAYIDSASPLVVSLSQFLSTVRSDVSVAVLGDAYFPRSIHGSLLVLQSDDQVHIADRMLTVLLDTSVRALEASPLLIPRTLHALITARVVEQGGDPSLGAGKNGDAWYLLEQKCHVDPLRRSNSEQSSTSWTDSLSYRLNHHCPAKAGYCCFVLDQAQMMSKTILMTRHPLLPFQKLPVDAVKPYNAGAGHYQEDELPFIATIQEEIYPRAQERLVTPNFFDVLLANDCLPSDDTCTKCLREKSGADCKSCLKACPCYCKTLCHEKADTKFLSKQLTISPPLFARDPNRLIPRIIHQTWFEELSREKYPNMSRLVESFRLSGWEYKFYADEDAASFLSTHFPAEVREAYDALIPGAFKADLFRYCVLLIHGGVYADVDIMLESALDLSVAPDIGFMVPIDEPGTPVSRRMCLWNGFIAAAPGHPFLAKAIETVVNQVRNRFTSVDVDATFCPDPEISILHAFDTLFTAGPCLLGASINRVLDRNAQTQFVPGEIDSSKNDGVENEDSSTAGIPGRTIILQQNKWDMGAHRFTLLGQNMVVAATDMPDSNDLENLATTKEHYSKTHAKTGIYGLEHLYADKQQANEDIRIRVESTKHLQLTTEQ